jgi:hypothetical protein
MGTTVQESSTGDYTKFVIAGSVALFESRLNGRLRVWEHPVKKPRKLHETTDAYVTPRLYL